MQIQSNEFGKFLKIPEGNLYSNYLPSVGTEVTVELVIHSSGRRMAHVDWNTGSLFIRNVNDPWTRYLK